VTKCAPCAKFLNDLREGREACELNGLVSRVRARKVASATFQAFILVNLRDQELFSRHVGYFFDMMQTRMNDFQGWSLVGSAFRTGLLLGGSIRDNSGRELSLPSLFYHVLLASQVQVSLDTGC